MKDRASGRRNLMPAKVAAVNLFRSDAVELGFTTTARANHHIGVPFIPNKAKAGIIIWEHLLKIFEGEGLFGHLSILCEWLSVPISKVYLRMSVMSRDSHLKISSHV